VIGGAWFGLIVAGTMKLRVKQLRELERIIHYLEGEIRYKHAVLYEACINSSYKCGQPFDKWLYELGISLKEQQKDERFDKLWAGSLDELLDATYLKNSDLEELYNLGQTLGYLDIKAQEHGLALEKENMHIKIKGLSEELTNKMKISVIMGILGAIFIVILLL